VLALIFEKTGITPHGQRPPGLIWVSITIIALLFLTMNLACVKGLGRVTSAEAVDSIFKPVTVIVIAAALGLMSPFSSDFSAYFPYVVANIVSAVALYVFFIKITNGDNSAYRNQKVELHGLFELKQAAALTLSGLVTFAYFQLGILIVATKLGSADAASFNMACNFVRVVIFVALIAAGQAQPLLAVQYRNRDLMAVRNTIRTCLVVSVSSAVLGTVFLMIFGRYFLRSVSPQFGIAYTALVIMSIAHIFNSAIIVLTSALNMGGLQNIVLKGQIAGIVPGAPLMLLLAGRLGMTGVALALLFALLINFSVLMTASITVFGRRGL
jgi:O-antigen/teichoic acid export membrane protein